MLLRSKHTMLQQITRRTLYHHAFRGQIAQNRVSASMFGASSTRSQMTESHRRQNITTVATPDNAAATSTMSPPGATKKVSPTSAAAAAATTTDYTPQAATAYRDERYPMIMRWIHWAMAAGVLTCFGLVEAGKRVEKPTKKKLMMYHKSIGIVMLGLMVPRVFLRLTRKLPGAVPGPRWEHFAAEASHWALYGAIIAMPVSGVTMLYFGNKDIPFFGYAEMHPKPEKENKSLAKGARQFHKIIGPAFEAVVAVHIGAVAFHILFKGQNILKRLHPFVKGYVPK